MIPRNHVDVDVWDSLTGSSARIEPDIVAVRLWGTKRYRILSCYQVGGGKRIYIITEWDRSLTTVLRPEEY